jgi:hypothetical protein
MAAERQQLKVLMAIVKKKIEHGEPWPGESATWN